MKLHPIRISMELLTPTWAAGADQQQAEIRIPTLRGQLRFWLRQLFPSQGLDNAIFGTADSHSPRASLVALRLVSPPAIGKAQNLDDYTGKSGNAALQDPEAYFLWPLRPTKVSSQKRGVIYPSSSGFIFELLWLPPGLPHRSRLQPKLQQALDAFCFLGSFGTRSTRGYGSVWPKGLNPPDIATLAHKLTFLPKTIAVRLLPGSAPSGREALAGAAKWVRSLRLGTSRFGGTPSRWGENDHDVAPKPVPQDVLYRPALGLPLVQNFRSHLRLQTKYLWLDPDNKQESWNDRYPSPVRFKVARIGGQYRVLLVIFRDQLLPEGTRLRIEGGIQSHREVRLSNALVEEMARTGEVVH